MRLVDTKVPVWRAINRPLLGFPSTVLVRASSLAEAVKLLGSVEPPFVATSIEREGVAERWLLSDEAEQ